MSKIANSVVDLIGGTPIVKLNRLVDDSSADVYLKLEYMNPGSSVKDRIALAMIEAAEKSGGAGDVFCAVFVCGDSAARYGGVDRDVGGFDFEPGF